jgi:transcriptional regulator with XRE-family HTH domain
MFNRLSEHRNPVSSPIFAIPIYGASRLAFMAMGSRIRRAREKAGYDQGEFARLVGMSQSALSEVETGESKEPRASSFWRMVKLLQLSPAWLAEGKGDMRTTDEQEQELLEAYRAMDERSRRSLLASARAMRESDDEVTSDPNDKRRLHINR